MYEFFQKMNCTVIRFEPETKCYEVSIDGPAEKAVLVCKYPLLPGDVVVGLVGDYKDGYCLLAIDGSEFPRLKELAKQRDLI